VFDHVVLSLAADSAFVDASSHRTLVLATLTDWPKTTGQVASACNLSPPHASRAVHELVERKLVVCLTPELRGRGRLYTPTELGAKVSRFLGSQGKGPLGAPMVRATHPKSWYQVLKHRYGTERALAALRAADCDSVVVDSETQWIPLRSQMRLLDEVESGFGDGSHHLIRQLAAEAVRYYPSLRKVAMRALPVSLILDLTPGAYLREFNHGRVEVDLSRGRAKFRNYDWLSSQARCAAWHGSYEGAMAWIGISATVTKQECILRDDEFCGYSINWAE